ncbi:MAG: TonB-dependent receptor [Bacteroidales bacterium]
MRNYYKIIFIYLLSLLAISANAGIIKGTITDKKTGETLIGVTILVRNTLKGYSTDTNGHYEISDLKPGQYTIEVRYIFYKTIITSPIEITKASDKTLNFSLEIENTELETVYVTARKNMENEQTLLQQRKKAPTAIENIGAKEMSIKGLSNVKAGVKKISGISFSESGKLYVRGLGDRYSTTTLNGLPIASSNPDDKLIPLDLFSTSTIQNVTVNKVFEVNSFADYSGAHIDINTKQGPEKRLIKLSMAIGGRIGSVVEPFYQSDKKWGLWKSNNISNKHMQSLNSFRKSSDFREYMYSHNVFGTGFNIEKNTSLPDISGSFVYGNQWKLSNGNSLNLIFSASIDKSTLINKDAFESTRNNDGFMTNFHYDDYSQDLKTSSLINLSYNYKNSNNITYTSFFTRDAKDDFKYRDGYDNERYHLIGTNSVFHEYMLFVNQLHGLIDLSEHLSMNWGLSYCLTESNEPDRRQVMYRIFDDERIGIHTNNSQETMRYFGELTENELSGRANFDYKYGTQSHIKFGTAYKNKYRDFTSIRFFYPYNTNLLDPSFTSKSELLNPDSFLNYDNFESGAVSIVKNYPPSALYNARNEIGAAFAEAEMYPLENLMINFGIRTEYSNQSVNYSDDTGAALKTNLEATNLFPSFNVRYNIDKTNTLRFSFSKTITRPSFLEMAPFRYQESYGGKQIQGNADIKNAFNYNIDLRYEISTPGTTNLISVTAYFKKLKNPIEQTQIASGGNTIYSFQNSKEGTALGMEFEASEDIFENLRFTCNGSYMFTDVNLQEESINTDNKRALQGASPYLVNADLAYTIPLKKEDSNLHLILMYNLQGPRIEAVGVYGRNNVIQESLNSLDFNAEYTLNQHWNANLKCVNILNSKYKFTQENAKTNIDELIEEFKIGTGIKIGISYKF